MALEEASLRKDISQVRCVCVYVCDLTNKIDFLDVEAADEHIVS